VTERNAAGSRRATAGLVAGATLAAAALAALTAPTLQAARAPGADPSALLSGLALLLGWCLVVRLVLLATVVLASRLPGAGGAAAAGWVERLAPRLLRSVVRLAVGVAVAAAPVAASATAMAAPPDPVAVAAALPTLDRMVAAPIAPPRRPHGPAARSPAATASVVVGPGDSLWTIAARHLPAGHTAADVAGAWPRWYAANRAEIGADPGRIWPGQVLQVPAL
jgi:resuscitation-promoting factor RpfA